MATINVKDAGGATVALEKPLAAGQGTMAASRPVVIASDQSAVPVSGTVTVTNYGNAFTRAAGASDSNTQRITIDSGQLGTLGQTTAAGSVPVVPASNWVYNTGKYVAVAAGQTTAVIQASAGAAGDYLDHVVVIPATTAPGVVTIFDNATSLIAYPGGGTTALLTLTPFTIFVGAISSSGAWKITTGANVSVLAVGRFS